VSHVAEGDRILISADRTPNVRGALVTGLTNGLPTKTLSALGSAIDSGAVKVVISLGEDLTTAGLSAAQIAKVAVIYLGTHSNATTAIARVVFPTLTVFEKSGTFVNQQFRIQKFQKGVPGAVGAIDDLVVLSSLVAAIGGTSLPADVASLWKLLAAEIPQLGPISFANLPETGLLLDGSAWAGLPFIEGETLHYKGSTLTATPEAGKPSTPVNS
jgi:NADH-quinone oxidoreductase subunit G